MNVEPTAATLAEQAAQQPANPTAEAVASWVEDSHGSEATPFRHVHRDWQQQCRPITSVLEALQAAEGECTDLLVHPADIRFVGRTVEIAGQRLDCTEHGLDMLSGWFGIPRAAARQLYADPGNPGLFEDYFRWRQAKHLPKPRLKVRLRGTSIRAVFTDKYREISNAWLLEAFDRLIPEGLVSHFRGDGDTISGNILIPDTIRAESDSDYGGGIGFRHSEVGIFRIAVMPFVYRCICCNGTIWAKLEGKALRKVHLGREINEEDLFRHITECLHAQIPLVPELIARMQALKEVRFASGFEVLRVIHHLSDPPRTTREESERWLLGYLDEGAHQTAFGILQGLTRAVRADRTDAGSRLEEYAGELVDRSADWWQATAIASRSTTEDALVRRFGEAAVGLAAG